ncbi:MAG: aspartate aminotransferase family protein, partial [Pyrinomonadaceae bacterium]
MSTLEKNGRESSLDVTPEALNEIEREVAKLVSEYFNNISDLPVFPSNHAGKTTAAITTELSTDGIPLETLISECRMAMNLSRHNGHPRFFGYVASPSTPVGAYADLVASALNSNVTCWRSAPAATEIETMVVRWLGQLIGYDNNARGLLTSGGSMANLIALLVASRKKDQALGRTGLCNSSPLVIYASVEVHMSIAKAADIAGLGRDNVHVIACDRNFRMDVSALRARIKEDLDGNCRPFCVVASAGTVATGAIDPLDEIGSVASEFGLWFHIDGAYGAPGVLDAETKELFNGLERADSISLDPHKWLYIPVDAGCLLFRDADAARATFSAADADYIKTHGYADDEAFAFWDYGVELSRRFRALKVWLTLQYYGVRKLAAAISEDIALAHYLANLVDNSDDFELMAPVTLSICCFRYVPPDVRSRSTALNGDAN